MRAWAPAFLLLMGACSDYDISPDKSDELPGGDGLPAIVLDPTLVDFGERAVAEAGSARLINLSNAGDAELVITELLLDDPAGAFSMTALSGDHLPPGGSAEFAVSYLPPDAAAHEALVEVHSNDPVQPIVELRLMGEVPSQDTGDPEDPDPPESFTTGWYVLDDGIAYETTSNGAYVVDYHGDPDLYWYEPSGAHGLLDSGDPVSDFAIMRDFVLASATGPFAATSPFDYGAGSTLATFEYATFTYFLCDFYLPATANPADYEIRSGTVDDGIQVMVNGEILGRITLGESGSWTLHNAVPGALNTLIIILVDDSQVDKYISDLGFYANGTFVSG